jgi:hypothetical protein
VQWHSGVRSIQVAKRQCGRGSKVFLSNIGIDEGNGGASCQQLTTQKATVCTFATIHRTEDENDAPAVLEDEGC